MGRRWSAIAISILLAALFVCVERSVASDTRHAEALTQDPDGVAMLYPSAPGSSSFRLGTQNPNGTANFAIEKSSSGAAQTATAETDGALHYWKLRSYPLTYASGGSGFTSRLHIYASGGTKQLYTWKTQQGYLYSPADVRNQEFTAYVRIHGVLDPTREAITLKIRGGAHTSSNGDLASCTMMTFEPGGSSNGATRFRKELVHPNYESVKLRPEFQAALGEGQWYGLKLVSYSLSGDASRVVNRLYLDTDPIDFATAKPRNNWRLFSEYVDVEGQKVDPNGQYSKMADWGGWETTLRTDGINDLDFAFVSVREIVPPQPRRRAARP